MTAQIIDINNVEGRSPELDSLFDEMKEGNVSATFMVLKEDGMFVGSSFKDPRDVVVALYKLEHFIRNYADSIIFGDLEDEG